MRFLSRLKRRLICAVQQRNISSMLGYFLGAFSYYYSRTRLTSLPGRSVPVCGCVVPQWPVLQQMNEPLNVVHIERRLNHFRFSRRRNTFSTRSGV